MDFESVGSDLKFIQSFIVLICVHGYKDFLTLNFQAIIKRLNAITPLKQLRIKFDHGFHYWLGLCNGERISSRIYAIHIHEKNLPVGEAGGPDIALVYEYLVHNFY